MLSKGKVFILLIVFCYLISGCSKHNISVKNEMDNKETRHFSISYNSDYENPNYQLIIYNKNGNVVLREDWEREPRINEMGKMLEIITSHGSSAAKYRYYDIENEMFSEDDFWNRAIVTEDKKIVYMDVDEKNGGSLLIIQDIFDKEIYYKEIKRDFSPFAVPSMIIENVYINKNKLYIEYFQGEHYTLVKEVVEL